MDLATERAESRGRTEKVRRKELLSSRAHACVHALIEQSFDPRDRIPRTLEEAAEQLYPLLTPQERAEIVERANVPRDRGRPVTTIPTSMVRDLTRAFLKEHPGATASETWRHVLKHGQPTMQAQSHAALVSEVRKELGIATGRGPRPKSTGPAPSRPRPQQREKGAAPALAIVPAAKDAPTPPPTKHAPSLSGERVEVEHAGARLTASRAGKGRWDVELEATVDGELLTRLVAAIVGGEA